MGIRVASPEEADEISPSAEGYACCMYVLEKSGAVVGHIGVSRDSRGIGMPLVHSLACWSGDPWDTFRLCAKMRRLLVSIGCRDFLIHHTPEAPTRILEFWERCQMRPFCSLFQGRV